MSDEPGSQRCGPAASPPGAELSRRGDALAADVTDDKLLEDTLREVLGREQALRDDAERHVRFSEVFDGMLGHDLRNPLGTITMGANYIVRANVGEKTTRAATRIANSAERMSRMIDQLIDFTQLRIGGGLRLGCARADLAELCDRVKHELEAANPTGVIKLTSTGNTSGVWDDERLVHVFTNLIGNAMTHGVRDTMVSVTVDGSEAHQVRASIHNSGVIAPEILPVLFEPFRGGNKRAHARGLGLGLYISREIVIAHDGTIDVATRERDGTTVEVRLPRVTTSRPQKARA